MRAQFAITGVYGCANEKLSAAMQSGQMAGRKTREYVEETREKDAQKTKPRRAAALRGSTAISGGDGGIRTLDPGFGPDAPLAGECLRPLGHVSQTFGCAREAAQRSQDNSGFEGSGQFLLHTFYARSVNSMSLLRPVRSTAHYRTHPRANACRRNARHRRNIKPDRVRMPYAARARRAPCTSRRSAPRS